MQGAVKKFKAAIGLKVPHIGWNQLRIKNRNCPLIKGIENNSYVYFCHSYYPRPQDKKIISATTDYGIDFASLVWSGDTYGLQFHPEKSQKIGLRILENFVNLK